MLEITSWRYWGKSIPAEVKNTYNNLFKMCVSVHGAVAVEETDVSCVPCPCADSPLLVLVPHQSPITILYLRLPCLHAHVTHWPPPPTPQSLCMSARWSLVNILWEGFIWAVLKGETLDHLLSQEGPKCCMRIEGGVIWWSHTVNLQKIRMFYVTEYPNRGFCPFFHILRQLKQCVEPAVLWSKLPQD